MQNFGRHFSLKANTHKFLTIIISAYKWLSNKHCYTRRFAVDRHATPLRCVFYFHHAFRACASFMITVHSRLTVALTPNVSVVKTAVGGKEQHESRASKSQLFVYVVYFIFEEAHNEWFEMYLLKQKVKIIEGKTIICNINIVHVEIKIKIYPIECLLFNWLFFNYLFVFNG